LPCHPFCRVDNEISNKTFRSINEADMAPAQPIGNLRLSVCCESARVEAN
jgi:hypothetical protein